MRAERDDVGRFLDRWKIILAEDFHERAAGESGQIDLGRLREAREVHHDQNGLVFMPPEKREDLVVFREEKFERTTREGAEILPHGNDAARPPKQRGKILLLVLDVDRLVMIFGIDRDRQVELLRIRFRETGIAIRAPLHRGAAAIAIAKVEIIAHPDFVAVIQDRRARHREEEDVEQLDFAPAVGQERGKTAANAEVDPRSRIVRVNAPHVVALFIGHHLERELVMIAQEHRPLAILRDWRRLIEDVDDRKTVLHLEGHEHPRHEREMKIHVRLIAFAEVGDRVLGPLVRFREQHAAAEFRIDVRAQLHEILVGLAQVLAARPFALI
jgi:hypothetical protein